MSPDAARLLEQCDAIHVWCHEVRARARQSECQTKQLLDVFLLAQLNWRARRLLEFEQNNPRPARTPFAGCAHG